MIEIVNGRVFVEGVETIDPTLIGYALLDFAESQENDGMMELKSISPDRRPSMRDDFLSNVKNGSIKFRSFQEDLNTIVYEKIQSKFISRPRNNFRKR